jgi:branched-chain amino acid transport system ATP-binding protein
LVFSASGEIFPRGRKINNLSSQEIVRAGIAHVPEGRRVFPYTTGRENLNMEAFRRKGQ